MAERSIRKLGSHRSGNPHKDTHNVVQGEMGNGAAQDHMRVSGALGRVFNRIVGMAESNTSPEGLSVTRDDLKRYLEEQLTFAEGEWFRGTKIDGVADKIMAFLDGNNNGEVTWEEFQVMIDEMRGHLIGNISAGASSGEIRAQAIEVYSNITGGSGAGAVGFNEIKAGVNQKLPESTEHKDLVAQLGALMVLDIVDIDESSTRVRDRSISEHEWMSAADDFSR